jgi:hypothetical protein
MSTPSVLLIPDLLKAGKLYSQIPNSGAVDFDVTRATTAFRTNASGILESVASGVPRLDYPIGGGCPSLLVEPAATNLLLRSEEFSVSGTWVPVDTTITANNFTAPNGTMTADRMNIIGTNSRVTQSFVLAATTVTFSVYLYSAVSFILRLVASVDGSNVSRTITIPAGQWTRFAETYTSIATITAVQIRGQSGSSTGDIFLWGAQLEVGSVATSYIPTVAATATRNADVISKSGVSGFIGQLEGCLYAEVDVRNFESLVRIFAISDGTSDNRVVLLTSTSNRLRAIVSTSGSPTADISTSTGLSNGIYKIALAYAANDFVLYVNGTQIGTDTNGIVPACTDVYLGKVETSSSSSFFNDRIRAAAIYPTRLSNAELAALTTL